MIVFSLITIHHEGYIPLLKNCQTPEELLAQLDKIKEDPVRKQVRNNGGGYVNHRIFWKLLIPAKDYVEPSKQLIKTIETHFGSWETFINQFSDAATKLFGSGWVWLVKQRDGTLVIKSYANQDTPHMDQDARQQQPVLGIDVWEHAYYLMHQNKRAEYIKNFWKVVNWNAVEKLIEGSDHQKQQHDEL
jgi:Fe-Mn family superoxide dismutase